MLLSMVAQVAHIIMKIDLQISEPKYKKITTDKITTAQQKYIHNRSEWSWGS